MDVLVQTLDGRGRWTRAVEDEAKKSSVVYRPIRDFVIDRVLGDPIVIDKDAAGEIERIRLAAFGGAVDKPFQHLGEAETCYVVERWPQFKGSLWITDDGEAYRFAQRRGITTLQTADLMSHAVVDGVITAQAGFDLLRCMVAAGRTLHRCPRRPDDLLR